MSCEFLLLGLKKEMLAIVPKKVDEYCIGQLYLLKINVIV